MALWLSDRRSIQRVLSSYPAIAWPSDLNTHPRFEPQSRQIDWIAAKGNPTKLIYLREKTIKHTTKHKREKNRFYEGFTFVTRVIEACIAVLIL